MIPSADEIIKESDFLWGRVQDNDPDNQYIVMGLVCIARAILVASQTLSVAIVKKVL